MKKFLMKLKSKLNWLTLVLVVLTFIGAFWTGLCTGISYCNTEENYKIEHKGSIQNVAVRAEYDALKSGAMIDKQVYVEGVVSFLDVDKEANNMECQTFNITTKGESTEFYSITNYNEIKGIEESERNNIRNGDKIKVYGFCNGNSKIGTPNIDAYVIEKLDVD
ncbi:hypothetical protein H7E67_10465 [Clostridium gasigenes]|uniref:hypothetical protein n=1 Tax=Clostridium gasigenes TaxID=94869 RepID=UPI0016264017|nr:hypothetical protein [Clostridium gasigenes]MBB6623850.1 hypothetical protein [Clostridium gasigenes]